MENHAPLSPCRRSKGRLLDQLCGRNVSADECLVFGIEGQPPPPPRNHVAPGMAAQECLKASKLYIERIEIWRSRSNCFNPVLWGRTHLAASCGLDELRGLVSFDGHFRFLGHRMLPVEPPETVGANIGEKLET